MLFDRVKDSAVASLHWNAPDDDGALSGDEAWHGLLREYRRSISNHHGSGRSEMVGGARPLHGFIVPVTQALSIMVSGSQDRGVVGLMNLKDALNTMTAWQMTAKEE